MRLAIDSWHQALRLAGPHRAPQAVADRVEAAARGALAPLAAALAPGLARRPGAVIRIRRLVVTAVIDVARPGDEAAPGYAAALARGIAAAIEDGGPDVMCFEDRSAYRAAFAVALAAGDAHRRWAFADFDGLAPLPPGAALRTLFEAEPAGAWLLLARLAREDAALALLGEADALRVIDVLLAAAPPGGDDAPAGAAGRGAPGAPAHPAAALLAALARLAAENDAPPIGRCAAALAQAIEALERPGSHVAAAPLQRVRGRLAERLPALGAGGEALRQAALRRPQANRGPPPPVAAGLDETPCAGAGLVVLLDELDGWLDADFCAALPVLAPGCARGAFALAVLAAAADPRDAAAVWGDAVWRALFDVDPQLGLDGFAAALERGDAGAAAAAATSQAAMARRGGAAAWRTGFGQLRRGLDTATGLWCAPGDGPAPRAAWRLARAELAALDVPLLLPLPAPWRALAAAGAQFVWRRAAWRVPGMRGASLAYLRRNLLGPAGRAASDDGTHWRWRVARAPLHVLVAMTTLGARERSLRGPPARRLTLEFG
ncbi:hypothetical protein V4F39_20780 [Aquincola sp. MAHUQ-54]|uniref:Uncharacterized protein n=1 Tax=Aquincola agrisoli TaxID=3119538 RepID=A0AAW9Q8N8_9BURK